MTAVDIAMCVVDCLLDDEVESLALITAALNDDDQASWSSARGRAFTDDEVRIALGELIRAGHVTPCAEAAPTFALEPVAYLDIGAKVPWEAVWFHLEPKGREAFTRWWESE